MGWKAELETKPARGLGFLEFGYLLHMDVMITLYTRPSMRRCSLWLMCRVLVIFRIYMSLETLREDSM